MPDFSFEQAHSGYVVGFDEAGCGPWAGPVVAAAAVLVKEKFPPELACQINDSKKLTAIKREKIFSHLNILEGESCFLSVGMCSVEEIDALNIREAAIRAMERASRALKLPLSITPSLGLADGTVKPKLPYPVRSLVKGDSLSLSIAAASIVAKVTRDQIMKLSWPSRCSLCSHVLAVHTRTKSKGLAKCVSTLFDYPQPFWKRLWAIKMWKCSWPSCGAM